MHDKKKFLVNRENLKIFACRYYFWCKCGQK